jgi:hypothetical protein
MSMPPGHLKNVWKYEIGDKLICEREENNPNDKFSVKLVLQRGNPGQCVGHVLTRFWLFKHQILFNQKLMLSSFAQDFFPDPHINTTTPFGTSFFGSGRKPGR